MKIQIFRQGFEKGDLHLFMSLKLKAVSSYFIAECYKLAKESFPTGAYCGEEGGLENDAKS